MMDIEKFENILSTLEISLYTDIRGAITNPERLRPPREIITQMMDLEVQLRQVDDESMGV